MKKCIYPDWVEKFRSEGKEIKHIGNNYYLHTYKTIYDKEKKRPKKISTGYLGQITENGLITPKKKEEKIIVSYPLEFGASVLLDKLGEDIIQNLKKEFKNEQEAHEIFVLGKQTLIENSPLKRRQLIYSNSYDSITYPSLALSSSSLTNFLLDLGKQRDLQVNFMKKYMYGNEYIIFDGTRLVSYSNKNNLAAIGYNHCGIEDPQINLLYCFSLKPNKAPVYFRANAGDKNDYDTIIKAIEETNIKNVIMIADKGFESSVNIKFFNDNHLSYIIPLRRNDKDIEYEKINISNFASFDGYFNFSGRTIFYKVLSKNGMKEIITIQKRKRGRKSKIENEESLKTEIIEQIQDSNMVLYFDEELKHLEDKDYFKRMSNNFNGYSIENYSQEQNKLGTIVLKSNVDLNPQRLYEIYKERELIEDGNKAYKNVLGIGASNLQNDITYNGWLFINHIALMLYYRILKRLQDKNELANFSVADIISRLKRITKQKVNDNWIVEKGTKISFDKLLDIFPECNTLN